MSAYAIAKRNKLTFILPREFSLNYYFPLIADIQQYSSGSLRADQISDWLTISDEISPATVDNCCSWMTFHEDIFNIRETHGCRNVKLAGYMQSWMYFDQESNSISKLFTFPLRAQRKAKRIIRQSLMSFKTKLQRRRKLLKPQIENEYTINPDIEFNTRPEVEFIAEPQIKSQTKSEIVFVGVHVRLGDWQYDNATALVEYLCDAIGYFARAFDHVSFIIASNEFGWFQYHVTPKVRAVIGTNHSVTYLRGVDPMTDLATLTLCNHTVVTAGTFGWWSAYLRQHQQHAGSGSRSNGVTLYFSRPQPTLGKTVLTTDASHYYYKGWNAF